MGHNNNDRWGYSEGAYADGSSEAVNCLTALFENWVGCIFVTIQYRYLWSKILPPRLSVCLSVLFELNFLKPWPKNFIFDLQAHLQNVWAKLQYQGHHRLKVKVTGA